MTASSVRFGSAVFKQVHVSVFYQESYPLLCPSVALVTLRQPHPHNHLPTNPHIHVAISQRVDCLCLSYFIEKKPWLTLDDPLTTQIKRQDNLWEKNCLECFVALSEDSEYLEVNVSPNGAYNIYRFDDYRSPKNMPPIQDTLASLWIPIALPTSITTPITTSTPMTPMPNDHSQQASQQTNWHSRHVAIKLGDYRQLYARQNKIARFHQIHPCVILYRDDQPIYYAPHHASPPDFHDRQYWQDWHSWHN